MSDSPGKATSQNHRREAIEMAWLESISINGTPNILSDGLLRSVYTDVQHIDAVRQHTR